VSEISDMHAEAFDDLPLLGELRGRLAAHFERVESSAPSGEAQLRSRFARCFGARRTAIVLVAALLASGGAAAAFTLSGQRSAPLSGRVPAAHGGPPRNFVLSEAGMHYRIALAPTLSAGMAGWSSFVGFRGGSNHGNWSYGESGDAYPSVGRPVVMIGASIGFEGAGWVPGVQGRHGEEEVGALLTGPSVAAVELGDRTIETRHSGALPAGDRVAVFLLHVGHPPLAVLPKGAKLPYRVRTIAPPTSMQKIGPTSPGHPTGQHAGRRSTGRGAGRQTRSRLVKALPVRLLGSDDRQITVAKASTRPRMQVRFWKAGASGVPDSPPRGACALTQHGLPGMQPLWGQVATTIKRASGAVGELLLSCVDTEYRYAHWPLQAAVLLNGKHPGAPPGPIPDALPLHGHPGIVATNIGEASHDIVARRAKNAWLVVSGWRDLAERLQVLQALRVSSVSPRR
jgi:hypothetical protein